MLVLLLGYLLAVIACAYLTVQWSLRPPCCPACRRVTEALPARDLGGLVPAIEVAHWCTHCARIVSRRLVQILGE